MTRPAYAAVARHERAGPPDPQLLQLHLAQRELLAGLADPRHRRLLLGKECLAGVGPRAGGAQVRTEPDQMFDHYAVEYTFADGTRMFVQGRHIADCWGFCGNVIHGPTAPRSAKRLGPTARDLQGAQADGPRPDLAASRGPAGNDYQIEHDLLFEAIRHDKPYNEAERCAKAAMAGILGRMAAESGKQDDLGARPWPRTLNWRRAWIATRWSRSRR